MKLIYVLIVFALITNPLSTFADDLQDISDNLVSKEKDFEKVITILMNHVHEKMRPNAIPLEEARKLTGVEKYYKGVGWCNHQVTIFMEFAQRQSIKTRMLYLLTEDMSKSCHTIAEAWDGNKWVVVDVGNNLIFKKKNDDLMSREDMSNNWERCLEKLMPLNEGDEKHWEMFLRSCYKVKELEP